MSRELRQPQDPDETVGTENGDGEKSAPHRSDGAGRGGATRRFWSARRVPAGVVAAVLTVIAIALLYEGVAASLDRTPARWRREIADELATRPVDDAWVTVGAVVAALLGLWLVVLALTPGLRGLLPMRSGAPGGVRLHAGLTRSAAKLMVRDRLMEVPGVESVRVRVGRSAVKARARAHFRPLDEVRADLNRALEDQAQQLGLARRMRLSARVRRPKK